MPNYVQSVFTNQSVAATSVAATINNQTSGNKNIAFIWESVTTATINSVTSTNGNTYSLIPNSSITTANWKLAAYVASAINPGSDTVTVNFSASITSALLVPEYRGIDGIDAAITSSGSVQGFTSGTLVTTNQNDILICFAVCGSTSFTGTTAPFVLEFNGGPNSWILQDRAVGQTGSYTAAGTMSSATAWATVFVASKVNTAVSNIWGGGQGGAIVY